MLVRPPRGEILQWPIKVLSFKKFWTLWMCLFSDDQLSDRYQSCFSSGRNPRMSACDPRKQFLWHVYFVKDFRTETDASHLQPRWVVQVWVRPQDLTITLVKMTVFWDVVPCSLVQTDRCFRGAYSPTWNQEWCLVIRLKLYLEEMVNTCQISQSRILDTVLDHPSHPVDYGRNCNAVLTIQIKYFVTDVSHTHAINLHLCLHIVKRSITIAFLWWNIVQFSVVQLSSYSILCGNCCNWSSSNSETTSNIHTREWWGWDLIRTRTSSRNLKGDDQ
jgi:hypothetical protein